MPTESSENIVSVWCGPKDKAYTPEIQASLYLNSIPSNNNVYLKAANISDKFAQNIPSIANDLLEVASYIYSVDQSKTRGGKTFPQDGRNWYRQFDLNIPVRCLAKWNRPGVKEKLKRLLRSLSDDDYQFTFRQLEGEPPKDAYFDFDAGEPWFKPDSVLLFSGGLDSLAGAIKELSDPQKKVLLVSHRPVPKIDSTQKRLCEMLKKKFNAQNRILHVPVWINKDKGITKDANQRSRSFLYASIACAISMIVDTRAIKFYENGIVSCNLSILDQVVSARASRSTHPKSLKHMSEFFTALIEDDFQVTNPFFDMTKSDVVRLFKDSDTLEFIRESRSCTRTRSTTKLHTHCGVCSQCIERRLAIHHNQLEDQDPEEMYKVQLFEDSLEDRADRLMVESYIQHAGLLEQLSIDSFLTKFPDCFETINAMPGPVEESAQRLYDLHHRHGNQVGTVVLEQIKSNADKLRNGEIKPDSLLGMIVGKSLSRKRHPLPPDRFPLPEGTDWPQIMISTVTNSSIVVRANGVTKRYTAFDIGFTDNRKKDLLNSQWDLLVQFAENSGQIQAATSGFKRGLQKHVQALNRTLRTFFDLPSNPINRYSPQEGWTTKFQIVDNIGGKS